MENVVNDYNGNIWILYFEKAVNSRNYCKIILESRMANYRRRFRVVSALGRFGLGRFDQFFLLEAQRRV